MTREEYNNYVRFLKENGVWGTFQKEWKESFEDKDVEYGDPYSLNKNLNYKPFTFMWYIDSSFPWWNNLNYSREFRKKWYEICKKYMKLFEEESKFYDTNDLESYLSITRRVDKESLEI